MSDRGCYACGFAIILCGWVLLATQDSLSNFFGSWAANFSLTFRHDDEPVQLTVEEDGCTSLLQPHIQKVALMFLVRGDIYHEDAWTQWIGDLADIVPASIVCDDALNTCYQDMLQRSAPLKSAYDRQLYYSIVVHTKPDYPGYKNSSIFHGRIVKDRVETGWASHSLVTATRILMRAALKDPYNQRFQLVCEATIPVRAPLFTHDQLLAQNMSRVGYPGKMYRDPDLIASRWPLEMLEQWPELRHHMKFHRQWVTLIRGHAQIVVEDTFLIRLFKQHCIPSTDRHQVWCISDEQYIGTLLSWKLGDRIEHEYCDDLAMALVANGVGIPVESIDVELLMQIRGSTANLSRIPWFQDHHGECHAVERPSITHMRTELTENQQECEEHQHLRLPPPYSEVPLYKNCGFFARKFSAPTAPIVMKLLQDLVII
ncbi:probable glycosyltransferase BC10 [Coccomyxa sp. Obi]|nr:probable glycosyltransferase BC10 [Coccomyxa sp. Obi]